VRALWRQDEAPRPRRHRRRHRALPPPASSAAGSESPCRRSCSTCPERALARAGIRPEAGCSCAGDARGAGRHAGAHSAELDRGVDCPAEAARVTWGYRDRREHHHDLHPRPRPRRPRRPEPLRSPALSAHCLRCYAELPSGAGRPSRPRPRSGKPAPMAARRRPRRSATQGGREGI
jgi:hypothetical protein